MKQPGWNLKIRLHPETTFQQVVVSKLAIHSSSQKPQISKVQDEMEHVTQY